MLNVRTEPPVGSNKENDMRAISIKHLLTCLSILALSGSLSAEEETLIDSSPVVHEEQVVVTTEPEMHILPVTLDEQPVASEEHVELDSRPLTQEKIDQMVEERVAELKEAQEEAGQTSDSTLGVPVIPIDWNRQSSFASMFPAEMGNLALLASDQVKHATTASYSPAIYHFILDWPRDGKGNLTNMIRLEDGSEWSFDAANSYVIFGLGDRAWRPGDTVVLAPKSNWVWGSDYSYTLSNRTRGSSVDVNPFLGPIKYGQHTFWVTGIDYTNHRVSLINGMGDRLSWAIPQQDWFLFNDWKVDDTVIIAENDNWLWYFSEYDTILINVPMNHFIRAKQL